MDRIKAIIKIAKQLKKLGLTPTESADIMLNSGIPVNDLITAAEIMVAETKDITVIKEQSKAVN